MLRGLARGHGLLLDALAGADVLLDRSGHLVERPGDPLEIRHRADRDALVVVAAGDPPRGGDERVERAQHDPREDHERRRADQHDRHEDPDLHARERPNVAPAPRFTSRSVRWSTRLVKRLIARMIRPFERR